MRFPILEVDARVPDTWRPALAAHRHKVRDLLAAADGVTQDALGPVGRLAMLGVRSFLAGALSLHARRRAREIGVVADAVDVDTSSLLFANLAYDLGTLGCSTFVRDGKGGPLLARNLDWEFPGDILRRASCAVRVIGAPAGPYAVVTWPGFVGALTAVAPGRFALAVNYVRRLGARLGGLLARAASGALPLPWAMRDVLDHARTFEEAVERVRRVRLLSPVLVTLAGTRQGEGVVVERAPLGAALRSMVRADLCVANHYLTRRFAGECVDYDDGGSLDRQASLERSAARHQGNTVHDAFAVLAPNVRPTTQQQTVMRASDGLLVVRVPGGRARTIETW
jgi:hypothetical protein